MRRDRQSAGRNRRGYAKDQRGSETFLGWLGASIEMREVHTVTFRKRQSTVEHKMDREVQTDMSEILKRIKDIDMSESNLSLEQAVKTLNIYLHNSYNDWRVYHNVDEQENYHEYDTAIAANEPDGQDSSLSKFEAIAVAEKYIRDRTTHREITKEQRVVKFDMIQPLKISDIRMNQDGSVDAKIGLPEESLKKLRGE